MTQTLMWTMPVGSFTCDHDRALPLRIANFFDGQRVEIVDRITFLLPAVRIQPLLVIALLIQQADRDQWIIGIARCFEVIAAEKAQTAGVDGQALGEAVLHRKVGDQLVRCLHSPVCM